MFLTLGLYFLFPACKGFNQILEERSQPYELNATVAGTAQLEKYNKVENIEAVSPVISFNTKLTDVNFTLNTQVKAVSADYLQLNLKEGGMFRNQSNMPFLILNRYAAEHFINEEKKETFVQVNDCVTIGLNGAEGKAIICGIFEDEAETPIVYMSYYEASKFFPKEETVNLLFLLTGKGAAEQVAKELGRLSVNVSLDPNAVVRWKLLQQQAAQYLITSLGFLFCSIILMRKQNQLERERQRFERQRLLLSGLTNQQIEWIWHLRILFAYGCCVGVVLVSAWIFGLNSISAAVTAVMVIFLHYLAVQPTG